MRYILTTFILFLTFICQGQTSTDPLGLNYSKIDVQKIRPDYSIIDIQKIGGYDAFSRIKLLGFDSARIDTTAMYLPCVDTTSFYLIYNASGKVVRTETSLQTWSIPSGGWASQDRFINPTIYNMVGYIIQRMNGILVTEVVGYLNSKKLPIQKPYLVLSKAQLLILLK